jgi:hypothetical protein
MPPECILSIQPDHGLHLQGWYPPLPWESPGHPCLCFMLPVFCSGADSGVISALESMGVYVAVGAGEALYFSVLLQRRA